MNSLGGSAMEVVARLLEPDEREAVLGDLHEAGENNWIGLFAVLGVFIRRHALLWKDWRPWLAALGVSLPSSLILMGFSVSLSFGYLHLIHSENLSIEKVSGSEPASLVCRTLLLISWAWAGGFVIGSLSRKTLWASSVAICAPCLFCLSRFGIESLSKFCLLIFLPPVLWGMIQGLRRVQIRVGFALTFAAAVTVLIVLTWDGHGQSGWHFRTWVLNSILSWPICYLVATAQKSPKKRSTLA